MGQKVHPKGFRLGVYKDWDARWYARGSYGKLVLEDIKIRKFLKSFLEAAEIARLEIERAGDDNVRVIIHTARPGMVIGRKGQEIETLRKQLALVSGKKNVEVSVQEVKNPELDAQVVAGSIASQLEKRVGFKQVLKKSTSSVMRAGARGVKMCIAGRLGGAEIARSEWSRAGSVPLHTLRADIDYGFAEAKTTYGVIGVKVWICRGESH